MPLETGTYISDLVSSNPAHTDSINNADAHMRLIKGTIQATFPGVDQPLTKVAGSDFQIIMPDGTTSAPSYTFASEPTLGFRRASSGVMEVTGGVLRNIIPPGSIHIFITMPTGYSLGSGGVGGAGHDFLELDGGTWNTADYPRLASAMGWTGPTFQLWDAKTTGRFLRSRMSGLSAGTYQANVLKSHNHSVSGQTEGRSAGHTHLVSGTTGTDSPDHSHGGVVTGGTASTTGGGAFSVIGSLTTGSTGGASTRHTHSFSAVSGAESNDHSHSFSVTSGSTGDTETRPEAMAVIFCMKT